MVTHSFVDPDIINYWKTSCQWDSHSAGCGFFRKRFQENVEEINPYNVYGYCYYNDSFLNKGNKEKPSMYTQETLLFKRLAEQTGDDTYRKFNGAPCAFFDGMFSYFNLNSHDYHAKF